MADLDALPAITVKDYLGNKGMRIVQDITEDVFQWIFRPQTTRDFGVDAHIEVVVNNQATGRLIAAQIKCGDSFFKEGDDIGYVFRPKNKHIRYWTENSLPVIIIICNAQNRQCWWTEVNEQTIKKPGRVGKYQFLMVSDLVDRTHMCFNK